MNRFLPCVLFVAFAACASAAETPAPKPKPAARTVYLVRHAHYAPDPKADEKLGPGISPLGVAQAHLVGARLAGLPVHFDALYVSPLQRARDTASIIAEDFPGRKFTVVDDLAECEPPARHESTMAVEGPKDLAACTAQVDRVFARYFKPASGSRRTELFVGHGNVIRSLIIRALGADPSAWLGMSIGHASISKILIEPDGRISVIAVGDVGHLPPNMLTGTRADPERSLAVPASR
jgi:serine/threonine-protein phosphatase PGAM5